jgi:alcohol dehydrogenase (cytochrome c)
MATPDLVWAGSLDGTFAAYDAKTLDVKWSMNVGTSFQGSPIAFNAGGKEYIAIVGGGLGLGSAFNSPELSNKSTANIVWVFGL